jgi:hypothetical protein
LPGQDGKWSYGSIAALSTANIDNKNVRLLAKRAK